MRSAAWRAMAWPTSCPSTAARPAVSRATGNDPGVDRHLAARQRKGVGGLGVVDDRKLPLVLGRSATAAIRSPTSCTTSGPARVRDRPLPSSAPPGRRRRRAISCAPDTRISCERWVYGAVAHAASPNTSASTSNRERAESLAAFYESRIGTEAGRVVDSVIRESTGPRDCWLGARAD